jgi:hypothetical protein
MEPGGSLPHSQESANFPYSEPDQSSPSRQSISNAENIQNSNLFNKITARCHVIPTLKSHGRKKYSEIHCIH